MTGSLLPENATTFVFGDRRLISRVVHAPPPGMRTSTIATSGEREAQRRVVLRDEHAERASIGLGHGIRASGL